MGRLYSTLNEQGQSKLKYSIFSYRMDSDAQLLANRIALLKQEEMKTWKKIDETRKRTIDILQLKHKNFERMSIVSN